MPSGGNNGVIEKSRLERLVDLVTLKPRAFAFSRAIEFAFTARTVGVLISGKTPVGGVCATMARFGTSCLEPSCLVPSDLVSCGFAPSCSASSFFACSVELGDSLKSCFSHRSTV